MFNFSPCQLYLTLEHIIFGNQAGIKEGLGILEMCFSLLNRLLGNLFKFPGFQKIVICIMDRENNIILGLFHACPGKFKIELSNFNTSDKGLTLKQGLFDTN